MAKKTEKKEDFSKGKKSTNNSPLKKDKLSNTDDKKKGTGPRKK